MTVWSTLVLPVYLLFAISATQSYSYVVPVRMQADGCSARTRSVEVLPPSSGGRSDGSEAPTTPDFAALRDTPVAVLLAVLIKHTQRGYYHVVYAASKGVPMLWSALVMWPLVAGNLAQWGGLFRNQGGERLFHLPAAAGGGVGEEDVRPYPLGVVLQNAGEPKFAHLLQERFLADAAKLAAARQLSSEDHEQDAATATLGGAARPLSLNLGVDEGLKVLLEAGVLQAPSNGPVHRVVLTAAGTEGSLADIKEALVLLASELQIIWPHVSILTYLGGKDYHTAVPMLRSDSLSEESDVVQEAARGEDLPSNEESVSVSADALLPWEELGLVPPGPGRRSGTTTSQQDEDDCSISGAGPQPDDSLAQNESKPVAGPQPDDSLAQNESLAERFLLSFLRWRRGGSLRLPNSLAGPLDGPLFPEGRNHNRGAGRGPLLRSLVEWAAPSRRSSCCQTAGASPGRWEDSDWEELEWAAARRRRVDFGAAVFRWALDDSDENQSNELRVYHGRVPDERDSRADFHLREKENRGSASLLSPNGTPTRRHSCFLPFLPRTSPSRHCCFPTAATMHDDTSEPAPENIVVEQTGRGAEKKAAPWQDLLLSPRHLLQELGVLPRPVSQVSPATAHFRCPSVRDTIILPRFRMKKKLRILRVGDHDRLSCDLLALVSYFEREFPEVGGADQLEVLNVRPEVLESPNAAAEIVAYLANTSSVAVERRARGPAGGPRDGTTGGRPLAGAKVAAVFATGRGVKICWEALQRWAIADEAVQKYRVGFVMGSSPGGWDRDTTFRIPLLDTEDPWAQKDGVNRNVVRNLPTVLSRIVTLNDVVESFDAADFWNVVLDGAKTISFVDLFRARTTTTAGPATAAPKEEATDAALLPQLLLYAAFGHEELLPTRLQLAQHKYAPIRIRGKLDRYYHFTSVEKLEQIVASRALQAGEADFFGLGRAIYVTDLSPYWGWESTLKSLAEAIAPANVGNPEKKFEVALRIENIGTWAGRRVGEVGGVFPGGWMGGGGGPRSNFDGDVGRVPPLYVRAVWENRYFVVDGTANANALAVRFGAGAPGPPRGDQDQQVGICWMFTQTPPA